MPPLKDLTGMTFGRLTVLERAENNKHSQVMWRCHCECDNEVIVPGKYLISGETKSCGCLSRELAATRCRSRKKTHNLINTRLYRVWSAMKNRCLNPNDHHYPNYGGRGITVCDEWLSFENFYKDAMALGYADDLTIDRIDVNDGYHFANVRFITIKAQQSNKRNNRYLTFNDETKCLKEWARELNINPHTLCDRLSRGWSVEKALTTPVGGKRKKK